MSNDSIDVFTISVMMPSLFALLFATFRSSNFNNDQFIEPAIKPLKEVSKKIGEDGNKDRNHNSLLKPFIEMSLDRMQLMSYMIFLIIGQVTLFAHALKVSHYTAIGSLFFYIFAFFMLFYHQVITKREVFGWWRSPSTRVLSAVLVTVFANYAAQDLNSIDVIGTDSGIVIKPVWISMIVFIIGYMAARSYKHKFFPSPRTEFMHYLDTKKDENFTQQQAFNYMNSKLSRESKKVKIKFTEEKLNHLIDEFLYQDKIEFDQVPKYCPPDKSKIRYKAKQ